MPGPAEACVLRVGGGGEKKRKKKKNPFSGGNETNTPPSLLHLDHIPSPADPLLLGESFAAHARALGPLVMFVLADLEQLLLRSGPRIPGRGTRGRGGGPREDR